MLVREPTQPRADALLVLARAFRAALTLGGGTRHAAARRVTALGMMGAVFAGRHAGVLVRSEAARVLAAADHVHNNKQPENISTS